MIRVLDLLADREWHHPAALVAAAGNTAAAAENLLDAIIDGRVETRRRDGQPEVRLRFGHQTTASPPPQARTFTGRPITWNGETVYENGGRLTVHRSALDRR